MTFTDCTADLVGQLNENAQKGMLQIVENIWLRHSWQAASVSGHIRMVVTVASLLRDARPGRREDRTSPLSKECRARAFYRGECTWSLSPQDSDPQTRFCRYAHVNGM